MAARVHLDDLRLKGRARVSEPLVIVDANGVRAGWFVGIALGERLLGFLQFDASETLLRASWFPLRRSADELPAASSWLDAETVRRTAQQVARPGETLGEPQLSFDRHPTRLLWRVPIEGEGQGSGHIAVIGERASREPGST